MERNDLTGQRFGRLLVIEYIKKDSGKPVYAYRCKCDCGNYTMQRANALTAGIVKSCGCYARERTSKDKIALKHGGSGTRIYITRRNMLSRCYNPHDKRYSEYGGRGIKVCDEWKNSFEAFRDWALANGYTDDLTIDRMDTNGDYCPTNCRFITRAENNRNRRCVKQMQNN